SVPSCTCSCIAREPPRDAASRSTPIRYRWLSAGSLHSEYERVRPSGNCTSMCEPAANDGSGAPSTLVSSKVQMSCASTDLRATRTRSIDGAVIACPRSPRLRSASVLGRDQAIDHLARLHAAGIDVQAQHLALGPAREVGLLALEHLEVLGEDLGLAVAD